ncbi:MAG: L-threonylcarbamoyladenylate synthase [Bacteroidota bacterium]
MQEEIANSIRALNEGQTLLYPTDTVWGIGCDATNEAAVRKVMALKQRDDSKSMIVLVSDDAMLNRYVEEVPAIAWDLLDLEDKPLTIIYSGARQLAPSVVAEDGSVGIRMVQEPFCQALLRKFRKPIVSTSANISGSPTPGSFAAIEPAILEGVDYVVNLRQQEQGAARPSGILKIATNGEVQIIRK